MWTAAIGPMPASAGVANRQPAASAPAFRISTRAGTSGFGWCDPVRHEVARIVGPLAAGRGRLSWFVSGQVAEIRARQDGVALGVAKSEAEALVERCGAGVAGITRQHQEAAHPSAPPPAAPPPPEARGPARCRAATPRPRGPRPRTPGPPSEVEKTGVNSAAPARSAPASASTARRRTPAPGRQRQARRRRSGRRRQGPAPAPSAPRRAGHVAGVRRSAGPHPPRSERDVVRALQPQHRPRLVRGGDAAPEALRPARGSWLTCSAFDCASRPLAM